MRGSRRLFSGLNFDVGAGELLEIRGPNGSGKSSLLRIVCGLATPAEGELRWNGKKTTTLREEYFSELAYLGHQSGVKDELTAAENLRISSGVCGHPLNEGGVRELLAQVGLENQRQLPARSLSAGQRRRLAMAQFLASKAKLWVLDEILTSLDTEGVNLSGQLLMEHLSRGGMAMVATHQDLNITSNAVKRIELAT